MTNDRRSVTGEREVHDMLVHVSRRGWRFATFDEGGIPKGKTWVTPGGGDFRKDLRGFLGHYLPDDGNARLGVVFFAAHRDHRAFSVTVDSPAMPEAAVRVVPHVDLLQHLLSSLPPRWARPLYRLPFCHGVKGLIPWGPEPFWSVDANADVLVGDALGSLLKKLSAPDWLLPALADRPAPTTVREIVSPNGLTVLREAQMSTRLGWEADAGEVAAAAAAVATAAAKHLKVPLLLPDRPIDGVAPIEPLARDLRVRVQHGDALDLHTKAVGKLVVSMKHPVAQPW